MTNADRIRNMTDEELAEWLTNICKFERKLPKAYELSLNCL